MSRKGKSGQDKMEIQLYMSEVKKMLSSLGFESKNEDTWLLEYIYGRVDQELRNAINQSKIPTELAKIMIDKTCGEYLFQKKNMGQLTDKEFSQVVSSLSEGDTTVSFQKEMSIEEKFDLLISKMCSVSQSDIAKFRKLIW